MLMTALLVWLVSSLVATVEESRSTWLLLGIVALAGRLAAENPGALAICFGAARRERGQTADRQAA
jgi:hypothetical protein